MSFVDPKTGKAHREFFAIAEDEGWKEISPGIEARVLAGSLDESAGKGHMNTIARWQPNAQLNDVRAHAFYEEVFIASGSLLVVSQDDPTRTDVFPAFSFACRPPGAKHGPFQAGPEGCVLFETSYFL